MVVNIIFSGPEYGANQNGGSAHPEDRRPFTRAMPVL